MIEEGKTYKSFSTGEFVKVNFIIESWVVYTKDWDVYKMPLKEFEEAYGAYY